MSEPALHLIRAFLLVAEHQSFARAAQALRMTPSSVSRLVKALEQALGVTLIQRTTRSMSLTEAGAHLQTECGGALERMQLACEHIRHAQGPLRGTLKLSVPVGFGRSHVLPHLAPFLQTCPGVQLDLLMEDRYVDMAGEGVTLAIRVGRLEDSSLVARKLLDNRRILVASPSYLAAHGTPTDLEQLKQHACISLTLNRDGEPWRLAGPTGERTLRPRALARVNNGDAARQLAIDGMGVAFLSSVMVADAIGRGELVPVLAPWRGRESGVYCVSTTRTLAPPAKALLEFLLARWQAAGAA